MEFHNILDCARGESKLRENSTLACPNFQTKAFGEETRNETTKNRTQHDHGSLNKQSACSINYLASALATYHRSQWGIIFLTSCKKLSKSCLEKSLEAVELWEYNSYCSDLNF